MSDISDMGADFFKLSPDLLAAAVWREAGKVYPDIDSQREFVNGYITARRQRDEYRREQDR